MASFVSDLAEKIFLNRYAVKHPIDYVPTDGQRVLVCIDQQNHQYEIGHVVGPAKETPEGIMIPIRKGDEILGLFPLAQVETPIECTYEDMIKRVAHAVSYVEEPSNRAYYEKRFQDIMRDWDFVPGGRILAAAGAPQELTCYNCYVIPSPKDCRAGIQDTQKIMAEIFARGGGVGINLSTLRPRYTYVKGVNGKSSGAVSWGELYSFVTGLIEQGGSRRGALMLILNVWHPDIEEFISSKRDMTKILNANISVGITDDFMHAVENDLDWQLKFPDTREGEYDDVWDGDIKSWAGNTIIHKVVRARDLWNQIIESAWASAEPGLFFIDRSNKLSNSQFYPQGKLICTNPCGEQPLPAWSVCNLGHVNLAHMVNEQYKTIDYIKLEKTVRTAIRFLDDVIDYTKYFFPENEAQQKGERRVGLGTIGLAEMFYKLEVRYGSEESLQVIDEVYSFIQCTAYDESFHLAEEKGSFPFCTPEMVQYVAKNWPTKRPSTFFDKLRNVTLLTQAPTGTVGTMVGTSTGIEPFYALEYTRNSRVGTHVERVPFYQKWLEKKIGSSIREYENVDVIRPNWMVTAMDLTPEDHVRVQAQIQKYMDSAISKTCNVPKDWTQEQVADLYLLMYKLGCKGGTIYRDGSRNVQVLSTNTKKEIDNPGCKSVPSPAAVLRARPETREATVTSKKTSSGTVHVTLTYDETGGILESFIDIGKGGSDLKACAEAMGRLISLVFRLDGNTTNQQRAEAIVQQLIGIGGSNALGFGPNKVRSLPDAVAQVIAQVQALTVDGGLDVCPSCHNTTLQYVEGCTKCDGCGYSAC